MANVIFLVIMVIGIIVGEVLYPKEGFRGRNIKLVNDTMCIEQFEGTQKFYNNLRLDRDLVVSPFQVVLQLEL